MKQLVLTIIAIMAVTTSFAQYNPWPNFSSKSSSAKGHTSVSNNMPTFPSNSTTTVSGYTRSNGTYVEPHVRTMPNNTNFDNFSTKGNSNPFTGSTGYRARDYSRDAYNYGAGQVIHTGPRGGQYYNNSNGRRTYVPKRNLW